MLNSKILITMAEKIVAEVPGQWLIFGGSSLYLLGLNARATMDVDVASFGVSTNDDTLKLMLIAQDLKLPIETINQAGAFFLKSIPDWQSRCRLFKKGKLGKVYVPQLDLYLELKAQRMTESDLSDCLAYLKWCQSKSIKWDPDLTQEILRTALLAARAEPKKRIQFLIKAFAAAES